MNILAGLDEPTSGQVLLDGEPIPGPGPDRAVLFQEPALFPWLSVVANVELALKHVGVAPSERRARAMSWLESVHLDRASRTRSRTSCRRGCASARRWREPWRATRTSCSGDEPFGALDAQARELLQNEVQRVWVESQGRKTFVFVTHNVREAALLADRVLVMSAAPGRLLEEVRIHAPRPRNLDDVLVARVVSEIHEVLMREVNKGESPVRRLAKELGPPLAGVAGLLLVWAIVAAFSSSNDRAVAERGVERVHARRLRRHDPRGGRQDADPAGVLVRRLDRDRHRARRSVWR